MAEVEFLSLADIQFWLLNLSDSDVTEVSMSNAYSITLRIPRHSIPTSDTKGGGEWELAKPPMYLIAP